jgi:hypothetical protein
MREKLFIWKTSRKYDTCLTEKLLGTPSRVNEFEGLTRRKTSSQLIAGYGSRSKLFSLFSNAQSMMPVASRLVAPLSYCRSRICPRAAAENL